MSAQYKEGKEEVQEGEQEQNQKFFIFKRSRPVQNSAECPGPYDVPSLGALIGFET